MCGKKNKIERKLPKKTTYTHHMYQSRERKLKRNHCDACDIFDQTALIAVNVSFHKYTSYLNMTTEISNNPWGLPQTSTITASSLRK